jgi:hypothetical protein
MTVGVYFVEDVNPSLLARKVAQFKRTLRKARNAISSEIITQVESVLQKIRSLAVAPSRDLLSSIYIRVKNLESKILVLKLREQNSTKKMLLNKLLALVRELGVLLKKMEFKVVRLKHQPAPVRA